MNFALLVMTDGRRDCIVRTIASVVENLRGVDWARLVIHDDSGEPAHLDWLRSTFLGWEIHHDGRRAGFGGAVRSAWAHLAADPTLDFVWHQEDDFTYNRPVNVQNLATVLCVRPYLAQVALRRQAWNQAERAAGGVVELDPDSYSDHANTVGWRWLEHRLFISTNPSLYRAALMTMGWPDGAQSEGVFSHRVFTEGLPWGVAGPDVRAAYWGDRFSEPWVHHIGEVRNGTGY